MTIFSRLFVLLSLAFFASVASATPTIDAAPITTYLSGEVTTALAAVGAGFLLLAVTAVGFKWIKGMIFG